MYRLPQTILVAVILVCLLALPCLAGLNVVVVLDDSGSMDQRMRENRRIRKMDAAKDALVSVLETLPLDAQVGVLLLNGKQRGDSWVIPLGPVDMSEVRRTMQRVRAQGGTPLGQYLKLGADRLLQLREKEHYGDYRLLVVTDGEATDRQLVDRYLPDLLSRGITIDVIGVDMTAHHSLATRVHTYRRADDPQSLTQAVAAVFAESTDTGSAAGESDFDLLEGFPDEAAVAALKALAKLDNRPIGQLAATGRFASPNAPSPNAPSPNAQPPFSGSPGGNQPGNGPAGQDLGNGWTLMPFMCVGFLVLWFVISRFSGKPRRR